jgi:glycosyltransferase involved in cell wall biosynthesis
LISGEYPPMQGGVADYTQIMARCFARRGHAVSVLTSARASQTDVTGDEDISVRAEIDRWGWIPLLTAVRSLAQEAHPDVINIQYQAAAYGMHPAITLLPRLCRWGLGPRIPCVVTYHDLLVPYLFPKAGRLRWRAVLALAQGASRVIVTNAEDEERLERENGLPPVDRIPIGSNVTTSLPLGYDRRAWRAGWDAAESTLVLCYFGFLNASKGGEELIEALATLRKKGRDVHLVMIGGSLGASDPTNRVYLERVRQAIETDQMSQHVTWTGHLSDEEVSASFGASDIAVLPYRDGASFRRGSLMAALTHGMPIVSCTPRVQMPEIVHGENMWLTPAGDGAALAEGIARLADDPGLRARLGAGARSLSSRFDWDRIADLTLCTFEQAIESWRRV